MSLDGLVCLAPRIRCDSHAGLAGLFASTLRVRHRISWMEFLSGSRMVMTIATIDRDEVDNGFMIAGYY